MPQRPLASYRVSLHGSARMQSASRRRSTFVLIGAFWAFTFTMLSVRAAFVDPLPFNIVGPRRLLIAALGVLLCLGVAFLLDRLSNRSFAARIAFGLAGALAMSLALAGFGLTLNRVLLPLPGRAPLDTAEFVLWVLIWLGYSLAWAGTHLALSYHWEMQDQQRRAVAMSELAQEARIAALRYQLNPHFLFNTINSISSLVMEERKDEAETMLLNLATFVRSTLTSDPNGTIALHSEIALQRLYLDIEEARFANRLQVEIDVRDALLPLPVPALILQPLVENAVRHGVSRSEERTTIRISALRRADRLHLVVENDGQGAPRAGGEAGLGLRNVRERLHAHYGSGGQLTAAPLAGGGFRAELALPLGEA